ncbi:polysaccharide deacteylase family 2 protein [Salipiger pallidus]|nr:polysaccharide deacteylase family 2 protein [Salipiger pallidus]
MSKGFVAGIVIGSVVSVAGAGVLAIAVGPPDRQIAERTAPDPKGSDSVMPGAMQQEPVVTSEEPASDLEPLPPSEPPVTETQEPQMAMQSPQPDAAAPVMPAQGMESDGTAGRPEAPALPDTASSAPADSVPSGAADNDTPPEATTQITPLPEQPAESEAPRANAGVSDPEARLEELPDAPQTPGPDTTPEIDTASAEPILGLDPEPEAAPAPADDRAETAAIEADPADAPVEAAEAPEQMAQVQPRVMPQITPEADPEVAEAPEAATDTDDSDAPREIIGTRAGTLINRNGSASSSRLPSIGGDSAAPNSDAEVDDSRPIRRFAAAFDAAPEDPWMSIVLIDDGSGPLGPDSVGEFPFPVSFAISPSHPDAAATAAAYRAEGFEVLTIAGAPEGAQASDLEVALEGALGAVPEAVAVMEDPVMGLQAGRAMTEQAAGYLSQSGHGLLLQPRGFNTGQTLAQREGVPAISVFRDFDGQGQDPRVMRRFLDQAAFKARQEEGVVMLGRLRADTVSALLLWGLQDRASSVAMVPVSALLRRTTGG